MPHYESHCSWLIDTLKIAPLHYFRSEASTPLSSMPISLLRHFTPLPHFFIHISFSHFIFISASYWHSHIDESQLLFRDTVFIELSFLRGHINSSPLILSLMSSYFSLHWLFFLSPHIRCRHFHYRLLVSARIISFSFDIEPRFIFQSSSIAAGQIIALYWCRHYTSRQPICQLPH
jgi:hypothetical protein